MSKEQAIEKLEKFKEIVTAWSNAYPDENLQAELRSIINQNQMAVRQQVIEAGCFGVFTIGPPPMLGGLIMKNVDRILNNLFQPSIIPDGSMLFMKLGCFPTLPATFMRTLSANLFSPQRGATKRKRLSQIAPFHFDFLCWALQRKLGF